MLPRSKTEVETPGRYHFSLTRWPEEMDEPIRADAELTVPDGLYGETKIERGRSLPIVKARLQVAGFDKTIIVTEEMTEATFTVLLSKGACDILAEFIGENGELHGANFLDVERE